MTYEEITRDLDNGYMLSDASGRKYKFDGVQMKVCEGDGFIPRLVDVGYIISKAHHFRRVEE